MEFQKDFSDHFSLSFLGQTLYFFYTDSILRVKMMYESVKKDVLSTTIFNLMSFKNLKEIYS